VTNPSEPDLAVDPALVDEQLQLFEKALRATQLYMPNNPVFQRAVTNVQNGFKRVWSELEEIELQVTKDGFTWEGHPVLHGREKAESLAWVLYKDGIRRFSLLPGVEEEEILRLLQVINHARTLALRKTTEEEEAADDLLTLLWTQDFLYVRYQALELGADDLGPLETSEGFGSFAPAGELQATIRSEVEEGGEEVAPQGPHQEGLANVDDFDTTLYFLDPAEIEYLRSEIGREYEEDLHLHLTKVLFDILEFQTYDGARDRTLEIIDHLIPHLLGAGDFQAVAYILAQARLAAEEVADFTSEQRQRLGDLARHLSEPEALAQMLQVIDDAHEKPTEEQLGELFRTLQPESLETLLTWIPRLSDDQVRAVITRSIEPLARAHPEAITGALQSDDVTVVTGALGIVIRLQLQTVGSHLAPLHSHEDPAVRLRLVEALHAVATPTAMRQLTAMVEDAERDVRIAAARALTERRHTPAAERIEQIVLKRLRGADLTEKRAFFETYGVLSGEGAVPHLGRILNPRGILRRKDDSETRACAAMALGKIGAPAAAELQKAEADKDRLVRNAVAQALREVRT